MMAKKKNVFGHAFYMSAGTRHARRRIDKKSGDIRGTASTQVEAITSGGPMIHCTRKMYHGARCVAREISLRSCSQSGSSEASNRSSSRLPSRRPQLSRIFSFVACCRVSLSETYFTIDVRRSRCSSSTWTCSWTRVTCPTRRM